MRTFQNNSCISDISMHHVSVYVLLVQAKQKLLRRVTEELRSLQSGLKSSPEVRAAARRVEVCSCAWPKEVYVWAYCMCASRIDFPR